jgi:hypothetical protein
MDKHKQEAKLRKIISKANSIAGEVGADVRVAKISVAEEAGEPYVAYIEFYNKAGYLVTIPVILGGELNDEAFQRAKTVAYMFPLAEKFGVGLHVVGMASARIIRSGFGFLNGAPDVVVPLMALVAMVPDQDERDRYATALAAHLVNAAKHGSEIAEMIAGDLREENDNE